MTGIALLTGAQDPSQLNATINALITTLNGVSGDVVHDRISAPIAAELVSISAAAIATNRALILAGQPDYPRKLQVRQVIVTAITAGILTIIGVNNAGVPTTEVVSLIAAATQTLITKNAFATVTSATVSGLVGGGDGTLGIGVSSALGLTLPPAFSGVVVFKENVDNANEAIGTVDAVAGTVIPTTAPNATHNYDLYASYGSGA